MELLQGMENTQTRVDSSLCFVFVALWIAKVHEETISKVLSDVSIVASYDCCTGTLIFTYHCSVVFGVELVGEPGRIDQVAEHHRQLPSFRFKRRGSNARCDLRGGLCLHNGLWCWLSRRRGCGGGFCSASSPHEYSAIFIPGELLCLDDLCLESFEIFVIQAKPYLEG